MSPVLLVEGDGLHTAVVLQPEKSVHVRVDAESNCGVYFDDIGCRKDSVRVK